MIIDTLTQFTAILIACIAVFLVFLIFAAGMGQVVRLVIDKSLVPDLVAIAKGLRRIFGRKQPSVEIVE